MNKLEPEPSAPIFPVILAAEEDLPLQVCKMRKHLDWTQVCALQGSPKFFQEGKGSSQGQWRDLPALVSLPWIVPTWDRVGSSSSESTHDTVLNTGQTEHKSQAAKASKTSCPQAFRMPVGTPLQGQMGTYSWLRALVIWEISTPGLWGHLQMCGDLASVWISVPLSYKEGKIHLCLQQLTFAAECPYCKLQLSQASWK